MISHSTFALKAGTFALALAFMFGAAAVASAQTTGTTGAGGATTTGSFDITSTATTTAPAPGLPNTGAGGDTAANIASLALSTVALGLGAAYLYSRRGKTA